MFTLVLSTEREAVLGFLKNTGLDKKQKYKVPS